MTNRQRLQALAERKLVERREEAARREKQYTEEILRDSKLTDELVELFEEDVTGFCLVETKHEVLIDVVDDCPEFDLGCDRVPYVRFAILDDELPGHRIPIILVRFRRGRYEFRAASRSKLTESATLNELRDLIHAALADMDECYLGVALLFARKALESDDDDFDEEFVSDEWVQNSERLEPARSGRND